jgi:GNAT superfamily N-acetyltransferase
VHVPDGHAFMTAIGAIEKYRNPYVLQNYITWYAEMDRRGGEHFLLLLRHGDEVAAMCDASWDGRFPERVYQQLTAVARPWRGKGLAKGVKAAMLKLIRARRPQARTMITNNADANGAIWSINRRLGFVVHRHDGTYQVGREESWRGSSCAKASVADARRSASSRNEMKGYFL